MLGRVTTLSDTAKKIRQRHTEMCSILPEVTEMPGKVIKREKNSILQFQGWCKDVLTEASTRKVNC